MLLLEIQTGDYAGNLFTSQASTLPIRPPGPVLRLRRRHNIPSIPRPGLHAFGGTASADGTSGNYISTVTIALNDITGGVTNYFNGTDFTGTSVLFLGMTGEPQRWSYNNALLSFAKRSLLPVDRLGPDFAGLQHGRPFYYDVAPTTQSLSFRRSLT